MMKHGHTCLIAGKKLGSATYVSWQSMKARVKRKQAYVDAGIKVCERWNVFENFLADMGERPLGPTRFTLDRIDNSKDYEPENCRWASQKEQNNNRNWNRHVVVNGERLTVAQSSEKYGINALTIVSRLKAGWDDLSAATKPAEKRVYKKRLHDAQNWEAR